MPNYRRAFIPGGTYFFTVVTHGRAPILIDEPVRHALRDAIEGTRQSHPFRIDAWVLLPDHLHCIWTLPDGDSDYASRWAVIKRRVSKAMGERLTNGTHLSDSRHARRESGVWQRRYWEHMVRDEADLQRCMDYLHWNPVKHGHVARVADWPHSTFHRLVVRGVYPIDWGGGGAENQDGKTFGE
ncbi:MAG: transposase [Betaproteobacteria bacterium]|nr:transposase [Betaproteobacteria bacterium]